MQVVEKQKPLAGMKKEVEIRDHVVAEEMLVGRL